MEGACSFETSVGFQRTTQRYIPEDRRLHTWTVLNIFFLVGFRSFGHVSGVTQAVQTISFIQVYWALSANGETSRPLAMRLREHRHNLQQGLLKKSKLAQHAYEEGHRLFSMISHCMLKVEWWRHDYVSIWWYRFLKLFLAQCPSLNLCSISYFSSLRVN
jgi:hypothetical protein